MFTIQMTAMRSIGLKVVQKTSFTIDNAGKEMVEAFHALLGFTKPWDGESQDFYRLNHNDDGLSERLKMKVTKVN